MPESTCTFDSLVQTVCYLYSSLHTQINGHHVLFRDIFLSNQWVTMYSFVYYFLNLNVFLISLHYFFLKTNPLSFHLFVFLFYRIRRTTNNVYDENNDNDWRWKEHFETLCTCVSFSIYFLLSSRVCDDDGDDYDRVTGGVNNDLRCAIFQSILILALYFNLCNTSTM